MRGIMLCATCGFEVPLEPTLRLKGFFDGPSQHTVACSRCNGLTLLVDNTTEPPAGTVRHWLLATQVTGPAGSERWPGTTSGMPELRIDYVERAAE